MIFGINTTCDISKIVSNFTHLTAHEITYNNFEISQVVFMPNITTNQAITYAILSGVNHFVAKLHLITLKLHDFLLYLLSSIRNFMELGSLDKD